MSSLTITTDLSYNSSDEEWDLTLTASAPSEMSSKIFVVDVAKEKDRTPGVAPQLGFFAWEWTPPKYVRVATRVDLRTLGSVNFASEDSYKGDDPDYIETPNHGTYPFGHKRFLTHTVTRSYATWTDANNAYQAARAAIRTLMGVGGTDTGAYGPLSLSVVGGAPKRDVSIANSAYPGDRHTFLASGGERPYTYSLVSDNTADSSLDTSTGAFVAGGVVAQGTVGVQVTDNASATVTITVTVKAPTAPPASEVLSV